MGSQYHAVGDEELSLRSIAEVIGRRLGVPTGSVPVDRAVEHFGFLGLVASLDCPASSALTRKQTGWEPVEVGLLDDLEGGITSGSCRGRGVRGCWVLSVGCGPVGAGRARAAEPHMSQPRAPLGRLCRGGRKCPSA